MCNALSTAEAWRYLRVIYRSVLNEDEDEDDDDGDDSHDGGMQ